MKVGRELYELYKGALFHPIATAWKPGPLGLGGNAAPLFKIENNIHIEDNIRK